MIFYKEIEIKRKDNYYITSGLEKKINKNLKILIKQGGDENYIRILYYIIDYIIQSKSLIKSNQTIGYYSWILKFVEASDQYFSIWEADSEGNDICEGADYAIHVISAEIDECKRNGKSPVFPTFSQNIVISKGVYEGLAINAVRYPSPGHMTGWWLTTELYDDNVESLMNVHFYHVAFKRPDILKYLALPNGYRFFVNESKADVWFDKEVLE